MPRKKAVTRKAATGAVKAAKRVVKKAPNTPIKDAMNKSQIFTHIAEFTDLSKKDVASVFNEFASLIERHVKKNGAGTFKVPGLMKIRVVRKPATKARKGINPFTGEETTFKAKPARNVVKVQALKSLKGMAA
ncbi:MAG: HU family DNA-binding protein [Gammaproteobacteria bacterium]|nr:HU family DNA-binding protein [Gammaproteobacteria bacterium]